MTKTIWTSVPAGILGQGSFAMRPYPGVVVCPTPEAVRGTGLRTGRFPAEVRDAFGDDTDRPRPVNGSVAVVARTSAPVAQNFSAGTSAAQQSTQNDDTTLGIHSLGRPQS